MKPELISEEEALTYLEDVYYRGEQSIYDFHFPFIVRYKCNVHIEGDLNMDWFENAIKEIEKYDFALLIIEGDLTVDGKIDYDRGIPILHVTGTIKSTNDVHPIWKA